MRSSVSPVRFDKDEKSQCHIDKNVGNRDPHIFLH